MKWYDVLATLVTVSLLILIYVFATNKPKNVVVATWECKPDVCVVYGPHYRTTVHPDSLERYIKQVTDDCLIEGHYVVWTEH